MSNALSRSHIPSILLLSFLFGSNLVVSRFALGQFHPLGLAALRLPVAAALALLWTRLGNGSFPRGSHVWIHGSVVGVFATAVPMMTFISALRYQSSGVTALFITLTPISAMLFAHFRLPDDRMTARKVLGAMVSFLGVGVLLVSGETGLGETRWEGFVLVLAGVAANGFGIVHVRKYLREVSSLDIAAVRLTAAAVVTALVAGLLGGYDLRRVGWSGVVALIYGALPGTLLGFMLYSFVAARFGPVKATQVEYLVPVVAVAAGAIFLDEHVTLVMIVGMVTVFAGIAVATYRSRPRLKAGDGGTPS